MLMEQEAPLLFHTVFAGAVILTVAYLLHWRGHSPQKKPRADPLFCPFTDPGLHLGLLRYDVSRFRREDLRFRNGRFLLADRNSGSHAGDSRSVGSQHK